MVDTYGRPDLAPASPSVRHPLEPLTVEEMGTAATIVRRERNLERTARFASITLHEPPKDAVLAFKDGDPIAREAFIVIREVAQRATYEAVVSISAGTVTSWRRLHDVQPSLMAEEFAACENAVRQHPDWQAAMRSTRGTQTPARSAMNLCRAVGMFLSPSP